MESIPQAERRTYFRRMLQRELADSLIRCAPLEDIRVLLALGAQVNEPVAQGLRPIHYAIYQQYQLAVEFLLLRGCQVDAMDDVGYTALHLCAEKGFLELAELLMSYGARVCFTDVDTEGRTYYGNPPRVTMADEPLRIAIRNDHFEMAELLLKHGANPNARYFLGSEMNLISPLAISYLELLLRYGGDPNSKDRSGLTPLMKACRHPQGYDAAELLVRYGADVNAMAGARHDFRTVLHYAVLSSNKDIVKLVLSKGAKVNMDPGYAHPTPLDFSVLRANIELIQLLLDWGADINTGSPVIGSPLHIALSEHSDNSKEIVKLLLENGADPNSITYTEEGKPFLKPPIGEYFLSTDEFRAHRPREDIVRLLLKYGAKVVMTLQTQNELGILKTIQNVQDYPEVVNLVCECSEQNWSSNVVRRSNVLKPDVRSLLLQTASTPQTLRQQCRSKLRKLLGTNAREVIENVPKLDMLPKCLRRHLLYEL
ncbi:poly [ADP-ribose] polymerase tankyrase-1 [Galendromus occidentalis]|uniref:Poly [ADP-ribose] polymerase tankyrase-1 n=1 Tax=Galendromus occidentalis TaxID=34638 RepID=A0AAJ7L4Q4_9ACAR|nr:poly [ADP-ribose] polymerase tankyrase-1 [Galendromus occidentalis]